MILKNELIPRWMLLGQFSSEQKQVMQEPHLQLGTALPRTIRHNIVFVKST